MKIIIYSESDQRTKLVFPSSTSNLSLENLASKVVPDGLNWRIVDTQDLPSAPQEQWRWTDSGPLLTEVDVEQLALEVRTQRNSLLQQSDWTQVADAPVDQTAWATYRQALRDLTAQEGFPEAVVWPVAPN